jgi:hypothetical protein
MMHGHEKSRSAIVAVKPTNKVERSAAEQSAAAPTAAESVERRAETNCLAAQTLAYLPVATTLTATLP